MGRIRPLGVPVDPRSRRRYLASLSVAVEATVLPLVGTIAVVRSVSRSLWLKKCSR